MEQMAKCEGETMRVLNLSLYGYLIIDFSIACVGSVSDATVSAVVSLLPLLPCVRLVV